MNTKIKFKTLMYPIILHGTVFKDNLNFKNNLPHQKSCVKTRSYTKLLNTVNS